MSPQARWEYRRAIAARYRQAARRAKGQILDEFCEVIGHHRKAAIRMLRGPLERARPRRGRGRAAIYSTRTLGVLVAIWTAAGYPWSVRLKALLPHWLPWARRRFSLTARTEDELRRISPRQMDRRLQPHKRQLAQRRYGRTKPGTLLKHHIPIQTERWSVTTPGFTEIDLVSRSGECADGEFLHALNVTDIHTTWVETRAVMGTGQERVQQALETMRAALPFRLRGIDSDNGSEYINHHLYRYCQAQQIQFTRGRPYKKDDNAHIEQENWTDVRKLVGYVRDDSPAGPPVLQELLHSKLVGGTRVAAGPPGGPQGGEQATVKERPPDDDHRTAARRRHRAQAPLLFHGMPLHRLHLSLQRLPEQRQGPCS